MTQNPFLAPYQTPHQTVPFDLIDNGHYMPALAEGLAQGRKDIAAIVDNPAAPTFDNTIVSLERAGELLGRITSVMYNLNSAETSAELQTIVREASPLLSEYTNDINLNQQLFERVRTVYWQRAELSLTAEQAMLLEKTYKGFARNGANLEETGKERLRVIDRELAQLALQFGEHVLNETNEYTLRITDENELAGLPDYVRDAAQHGGDRQDVDLPGMEVPGDASPGTSMPGWVFTLQAPSYGPFMQYADNRELRRTLFLAFSGRGFRGNKNDNSAIIRQIVDLRYERANLLGYSTHADFVLEESMAGSRDKVQAFLDELVTYARPAAERQLAELTDYARANGFPEKTLQAWDSSYYAEKLRKEKYDLNDETLKPYFDLNNVLNGAFAVAGKLYGLTFQERTDIPTYHPEVRTFDVLDRDGAFLAVFYGDFFPRASKRSGAWMSDLRGQKVSDGQNIRPHIINVCNFTRPLETATESKPSLLTFYEVTTLFHEFGHGLHGILANSHYESLSGTNVPRDFVELPSQVMENWCYDPEALRLFARHYQTGEMIPAELIEKIRASQHFMAGMATLRQLRFGLIDMYYHGQQPTGESVTEVERRVDALANLFPPVPGIAFSTAFSHIFAGGYSAGYYSYKWSEVLDADAFEFFAEHGGLNNQAAADSFRRNVLERGGSEKPMELYRKFRGREPSPKAMLRRSGLLT